MLRLMLLRHAKTVVSDPQGDRARPLNERGRTTAPEIGRYMAHEGLLPDLVLCSTAKRTRQTLELLAARWPGKPEVSFESDLYLADPATILQSIRMTPATSKTLLIVGHNPGIRQAAFALCTPGRTAHYALLQSKFPTAALTVIDFAGNDWARIAPGTGKLDRFITPRLLAGDE